jgi:4-hydroxy-tetrahydrodipicolinate synthase
MQGFTGIWIPIVTPFRDGRIDHEAAQRLVGDFARAGCAGIVVCGTTGEAGALSTQEKDDLLRTVREAAGTRLGVVMGLSGCDTAGLVAEARHFEDAPLDGWLVTAPYYVRPSQEGVRRHVEALADASAHPIVLYNIPHRTGVNMALDTVRRLCERPQVVAIKECGSGDVAQLHDLLVHTPLKVLAGEDDMIFVAGCLGAHGAIAAAAHVRPDLYVRMRAAIADGRLDEARALHRRLSPMIRLLFAEPNPGPVKAALAMQGRIADELRLPMTPASASTRAALHAALAALEGD